MIKTGVTLAGVELKNPVMTASGTFGSGAEYSEFVDLNRLGAVVTKGVANVPWPGNPTPRVTETASGMLNAIGLQNPGIDLFCKRDIPFLKQYDTKIVVNVCGKSTEDYCEVVERLGNEPVDLLEINVSCPNVKEGGIAFGQDPKALEAITKEVKKYAKDEGQEVFVICAQIEQEIAELDDDEKKMFLEDLGLAESGLEKLIKASYSLLGLISYLTSGETETRAWTIKKGTKAPQAAGKIHSDFERGFIRAEVVSYDALHELGSMLAAKEKGLVRSEGKEYIMQDGDVVLFRFNV